MSKRGQRRRRNRAAASKSIGATMNLRGKGSFYSEGDKKLAQYIRRSNDNDEGRVCRGKYRHGTWRAAAMDAMRMSAKGKGKAIAYRCPFCSSWHAAHEMSSGDRQTQPQLTASEAINVITKTVLSERPAAQSPLQQPVNLMPQPGKKRRSLEGLSDAERKAHRRNIEQANYQKDRQNPIKVLYHTLYKRVQVRRKKDPALPFPRMRDGRLVLSAALLPLLTDQERAGLFR